MKVSESQLVLVPLLLSQLLWIQFSRVGKSQSSAELVDLKVQQNSIELAHLLRSEHITATQGLYIPRLERRYLLPNSEFKRAEFVHLLYCSTSEFLYFDIPMTLLQSSATFVHLLIPNSPHCAAALPYFSISGQRFPIRACRMPSCQAKESGCLVNTMPCT